MIVDPRGNRGRCAGEIDHAEGFFVFQETMQSSSLIDVTAHGLGRVIDAEDHGVDAGTRGIDGGEDIPVADEAMAPDARFILVLAGAPLCRPELKPRLGVLSAAPLSTQHRTAKRAL